LEDVKRIGQEAAKAIMNIYTQNTETWDVQFKDLDNSPLTRADLEANEIICSQLKNLYPSIPIISEENKQLPYEDRKNWKYFFCVDPLDGTKEFIKRNGQFTVNIGLCENGRPVLGLVIVPADNPPRMYYGIRGEGFPCVEELIENDLGYDAFKTIRCKEFSISDEGLTIVASASHNTPETEEFIRQFKSPKTANMGSSLKLLLVAEGKAHVYPRLAPTSEWDTCAAQAVVEAAGGQVLQHKGGLECDHLQPVVYNKPNLLNPFFVVYGKIKQPKSIPKQSQQLSGPSPLLRLIPAFIVLIAAFYYFLTQ
jgi:3'(2'), 5'-bisphosphate nucleotidase